MALIGDLSTFSFVDIFQVILKDRKSGIFIIEWKDMTVACYVKDGEFVFARPIDKVFRVYAEKDFDVLLSKLRIPKESLHKTIERFLISRFDHKEGIFSFTPGFIKYNSDVPVVYNIEKLILLASEKLSPEEVERKISDELLTFEALPNAQEIVEKANTENIDKVKKVLSLVNGERTVGEIRKESGLDTLTVDRILYALLAMGAIKRKRREKKQKPSIAMDLLVKIIERVKGL
ncbi:DUF4388 domain-containing protein [Thermocrinis minervae]|uniref:PatA-like N-terminal domain-containing protein n=1 Tax=Thermocrinis minervae TaxID=381751 RepID=A0A1M6SPD1_9AQUI|nr:DUF4388 domain-containing protein [Thermocrinis minervae]SHK46563.1 protein of unknown function [Thermocrinis minervae]